MQPVASFSPPTDPPQDRAGKAMPHNLAIILHAARILLGYGSHLLETLHQRATATSFNSIAACFGTGNLSTIRLHLNRGILRAAALERFLLARAAAGRDFFPVEPRIRAPQPAPAAIQPEQPATTRKPAPRPTRPTATNDADFFMPTPEELDRQVRRTPIGRTIAAICCDLGVVPGFCLGPLWTDLMELMQRFGGGLISVMEQRRDHEKAFDKEQDRVRGRDWAWLSMSRDALHDVLGFFIGEPPVNPFDPAPATATGPP